MGGRFRTPAARAQFVRQKLSEMVRRAPQVMVKTREEPRKGCAGSRTISATFHGMGNSTSRIKTGRSSAGKRR